MGRDDDSPLAGVEVVRDGDVLRIEGAAGLELTDEAAARLAGMILTKLAPSHTAIVVVPGEVPEGYEPPRAAREAMLKADLSVGSWVGPGFLQGCGDDG